MLVAFKVMVMEAIQRMHTVQQASLPPARHVRWRAPGTVLVRVRVARRRPQRISVHAGQPKAPQTGQPLIWQREERHSRRPDEH